MINVCGTYDEDVFLKFTKIGTTYVNDRMKFEADRRKNFCESRSKSRQSSKNQTVNKKSYVPRMETETETINVNKDIFINNIEPFKNLLSESYQEFIDYWTEPSKSGKLRYEAQKFFDIKRRVNTWLQNKNKYGNSKNTDATATSRKRMEDLAKWVNQ